jgi:hypothetical protein
LHRVAGICAAVAIDVEIGGARARDFRQNGKCGFWAPERKTETGNSAISAPYFCIGGKLTCHSPSISYRMFHKLSKKLVYNINI